MIKANHHWWWQWFFNRYIAFILKRDFRAIFIEGEWNSHQSSHLLIGNHFSWWDGFWARYLNNRFLKKKVHIMMLESQLKDRLFLSRIGGFSVQPKSRSAIESLNYAAEKLMEPGNLLVIYPQGRFAAAAGHVLPFAKGIERVLKLSAIGHVLFYAVFIDYFSHRKPSLYFYLKNEAIETHSAIDLQLKYEAFYEECRLKQNDKAI